MIMNSLDVHFFLSKLKPLQEIRASCSEIRCIDKLDCWVQKSEFDGVFGAYSTADKHVFSALN